MRHFLIALSCVLTTTISANAQDDGSVVKAYLTESAPEIDGVISPGEWDAAAPAIVFSPEDDIGTDIPDDPYGGPEDLSFQFRVMWQAPWTALFLV